MNVLFATALALLGLLIGSFLNVVIARVPRELSIVRPGSHCPVCGHSLRWYENIPLLSWIYQRGRCTSCKSRISWRYPLVEALTALLFLAFPQRFGWTGELSSPLVPVVLFIPFTFIDLEHWLLPFALTIPGIALGLLFSLAQGLQRFQDSAIGAAAGFFGFWAIERLGRTVFKKEALGGGDKYLLALIGAFLTYRPLLGVVFLASVQGALVGSVLLVLYGRAGPAPAQTEPPSQPANPPGPPGAAGELEPALPKEEEEED